MKSKFAALAAFLICMLPAARIEHAQAVMLFSKKDKQEMERLMESLKQEENPAFQLTDEKASLKPRICRLKRSRKKKKLMKRRRIFHIKKKIFYQGLYMPKRKASHLKEKWLLPMSS